MILLRISRHDRVACLQVLQANLFWAMESAVIAALHHEDTPMLSQDDREKVYFIPALSRILQSDSMIALLISGLALVVRPCNSCTSNAGIVYKGREDGQIPITTWSTIFDS